MDGSRDVQRESSRSQVQPRTAAGTSRSGRRRRKTVDAIGCRLACVVRHRKIIREASFIAESPRFLRGADFRSYVGPPSILLALLRIPRQSMAAAEASSGRYRPAVLAKR